MEPVSPNGRSPRTGRIRQAEHVAEDADLPDGREEQRREEEPSHRQDRRRGQDRGNPQTQTPDGAAWGWLE